MPCRELRFSEAVREAIDLKLAEDPCVYVMGLGVPDPKGIFGTTLGLREKYGDRRAFDMPCSENAMTGVALGSALAGMRPILVHQRIDFALLSLEQIVNQAANWHYMFGGRVCVPLVIRMIVGRGWGQGPQHSQDLSALFSHIPGLKVVAPTTPRDAKGLLLASIEDNNPVIFIEHRWLMGLSGQVPAGTFRVPLGQAQVIRQGADVTLVSFSYMSVEALRVAALLEKEGVSVEVVDLRTLKPLDFPLILDSVRHTGRLMAVDCGWKTGGLAGEIVARVAEEAFPYLKAAPVRIGLPDCPTPTTRALADHFYPLATDLAASVRTLLGREPERSAGKIPPATGLDVPGSSFAGPF